jgi:two-component system NtrC family sensor kinase
MELFSAVALPPFPNLAAEDFFPQISTVLLLLAGTVFVYRSFRESYLPVWMLGWFAFLLHKMAAAAPPDRAWLALSHVNYAVAIVLFAASILLYANQPRLLKPLMIMAAVAIDLALFRVILWPNSLLLDYAASALYAAVRIVPAVELALFSRGRRNLGCYALVVSLLLLHIHENSMTVQVTRGFDMFVELLVGVGMLLMVLDESHDRSRRLQAVNLITAAIAQERSLEPIIDTALRSLKDLTGARAAWFRQLDGGQLVLVRQVGLPEEYVRQRHLLDFGNSASGRVIQQGGPAVVHAAMADGQTRQWLRAAGFNHVIIAPVEGKNSIIGTLALAMARDRRYRPEELRFLANTGHQLAIAVENLRLLEQILRSQKQWVSTFDSIEDCILVHDQNFRILKINRALLNRLQCEPVKVIRRTCDEALPRSGEDWRDCPWCWRVVSKFGETADPCLGGYSQVSSSSYVEQETGVLGTIHIIKDITERRAQEEIYRKFFEQMQEGVFMSTPEGQLVDCNDALVRMLGYASREELLSLHIGRDIYDSPRQRDEFVRQMAESGFVRSYEVMLRRKDGGIICALETSFATLDASGAATRYQGFLLDITEKKHAEDEIRRRNRELAALNSIAVVANQSLDLEEILNVTLRQVIELFSADTGDVYLLDETAGMLRRRAMHGHRTDLAEDGFVLPPDLAAKLRDTRVDVVTSEHLPLLPQSVTEFVRAEGLLSWIWVLLWTQDRLLGVLAISSRQAREFSTGDQHLMVAIGRQLATTIDKVHLYQETRRAYEDLRRAQEQLLQAEKMSAIGRLVSGVAHELNNPLTAILGYAQLLETEGLHERALDFVQKLYKQTQRTHRIVQNLLSFSRQRKPFKQSLDLRRVLEDVLALREYDLHLNNIIVHTDVPAVLSAIVGDSHQLEQVFLNIINNAVDAILEQSRGGQLKVRIRDEGGQVCVEFHDSGPGILDLQRIFDPFFTTKGVGKGTGLGLSICYGIVKEHGGEVIARNHPEGGAIIEVRLPALSEAIPTANAAAMLNASD